MSKERDAMRGELMIPLEAHMDSLDLRGSKRDEFCRTLEAAGVLVTLKDRLDIVYTKYAVYVMDCINVAASQAHSVDDLEAFQDLCVKHLSEWHQLLAGMIYNFLKSKGGIGKDALKAHSNIIADDLRKILVMHLKCLTIPVTK